MPKSFCPRYRAIAFGTIFTFLAAATAAAAPAIDNSRASPRQLSRKPASVIESDEPLWHFPLTEAWSDFIGPLQGTVLDKAECGPGRFITTIQMSLSGESPSKSDQTKSAISVGSVQGYCDDGLLLPRHPSEGGPNDMFLVVSTEGFRDFVGAASETLETFMFVGQEHSNSSRFSLSCPRGLRMTGYQTRVTSVVLAIKFKCGKV